MTAARATLSVIIAVKDEERNIAACVSPAASSGHTSRPRAIASSISGCSSERGGLSTYATTSCSLAAASRGSAEAPRPLAGARGGEEVLRGLAEA